MNLAEEIRRNTSAHREQLMICWLGQAGYLLKDGRRLQALAAGSLPDELRRTDPRLQAALADAAARRRILRLDYYVITHTCTSIICDYDAIPVVKERSPKGHMFFGPTSCLDVLALKWAVEKQPLPPIWIGGDALWGPAGAGARRPPLTTAPWRRTPSGFCWRLVGHRLYFSGDTAFH